MLGNYHDGVCGGDGRAGYKMAEMVVEMHEFVAEEEIV